MTTINISGAETRRRFGRVGYLRIEDDYHNMVQYGTRNGSLSYDIKFDIEKVGIFVTKFSASILGLGGDTINNLTVWDLNESIKRGRRIEVFAGYNILGAGAQPDVSMVGAGYIMTSRPTNPPNRWMDFNCIVGSANQDPVQNPHEEKGADVKTIFEVICELNGRKPNFSRMKQEELNKAVPSYVFEGPPCKMFDKFMRSFNVRMLDNGEFVTLVPMRERYEKPVNASTVSIDNGLIDTVEITQAGAVIRMRMNERYSLFDWVRLESAVNSKYNGYYYIIKQRHVGHLRGGEWFTEYRMLRYIPRGES